MTSRSDDYMLPPEDEKPEEFVSMHKPPPEFAKPEPVTNTLVDAPNTAPKTYDVSKSWSENWNQQVAMACREHEGSTGDIGPSCSPGANGRPGDNGHGRLSGTPGINGATPLPDGVVFDDVMVDIETMSLHPSNALILSIGLVEFNPSGDELLLGREMLLTPDVYHQLLIGRHVDKATQKFWLNQDPKAADHWLHAESRWPLKATALAIGAFLSGKQRVWANGFLFDLGNIVSLCEQADERTPWHYRAPRDARTFWEQTPITRAATEIGDALDFADKYNIVPHEPLSDCITQAHRVWQHWPKGAET